MQTETHLYPASEEPSQIVVAVPSFAERKAKLSTFTVYTIKGEDKEGLFEFEKRYSDFDHLRPFMVQRWPGCFVPPLPKKKVVGNSDAAFVEQRRIGLEIFLKDLAKLTHLWYSREFQTFLRSSGDIEKQLKNLPHENHEDIIKKYDEVFPKLQGRSEDTMTLARVLDFGNYIKKILPVIVNFKEMSLSFIEAKNANAEQFSVLLNYVLPEYEKSCLSVYCNQITEGKFIFNEKNDERLAGFVASLKELMSQQEFEGLYHNLELEEREVEAFLEIYKVRDHYDQKLKDLKSREKDLELELVKLNAGKQGMFSSLMSSVEKDKAKANKQIESVKEDIKVYSFLNDLIIILLGHFEIERFRKDKLQLYFSTMKKIAVFQIQFNTIRRQICDHILENHNLL